MNAQNFIKGVSLLTVSMIFISGDQNLLNGISSASVGGGRI